MKKTLLSGLFWVLFANLLVKPFWILGIEVDVQNAVDAEMYGLYFTVFNITYIFNILLDLGITNFNTRNIAQHPHLITKHLSGILTVKLLLLVLYAVVTFSAGALMGYDSLQFRLLAWLSLNQFLSSLILYLRSNFEGLMLFKWDSLLSVMDRLLMIIICGSMLWCPSLLDGNGFTIFHFVYAQTAAYIVTAILATTVLVRKTGLRRLRFDKLFSLAILRQSLPFALLVLLMASYNRIDPVLLQKLSPAGTGNYNAGIYAGAFRLIDALTMVAYIVSVPLLPIFSRLTKKGAPTSDSGELREVVRMMTGIMTVFSVTVACALASTSDDIMALFYNDHVTDYSSVLRIVVFCIIPVSMTYVFGTLMTAAGKLKMLNIFAASSLLLNIAVNLFCIPRWGAQGSAIAGLTAQSFMALAQIIAAIVLFKLQLSWKYILKILLFTLSVIVCVYLCAQTVWWVNLMITALVATTSAFMLKLIDLREIISTLTTKETTNNEEK